MLWCRWSVAIDPAPVADAYGAAYKLIEKSIRQAWDIPELLVSPFLSIGGDDAKWFAAKLAAYVYRFTAIRVESAADTARCHGVNERVLVRQLPSSIVFSYQLQVNVEDL